MVFLLCEPLRFWSNITIKNAMNISRLLLIGEKKGEYKQVSEADLYVVYVAENTKIGSSLN